MPSTSRVQVHGTRFSCFFIILYDLRWALGIFFLADNFISVTRSVQKDRNCESRGGFSLNPVPVSHWGPRCECGFVREMCVVSYEMCVWFRTRCVYGFVREMCVWFRTRCVCGFPTGMRRPDPCTTHYTQHT